MLFRSMNSQVDNESLLPLITTARYGPPERCYGHEQSRIPCATLHRMNSNDGRNVYFPWQPGLLYYKDGFEDFKFLLLDVLEYLQPNSRILTTNAPASVEVFFDQCGPDQYLLQLLNLSGFNGTTVRAPLPIHDLIIKLNLPIPKSVMELSPNGLIAQPEKAEMNVDLLESYQAFLVEIVSD